MKLNKAARNRAATINAEDVIDSGISEEELELLESAGNLEDGLSEEEMDEFNQEVEKQKTAKVDKAQKLKEVVKQIVKEQPKQLYANLIRGKVYYYKGIRYEENKPIPVDKETAEYLAARKEVTNVGGEQYELKVFKVGTDKDAILKKKKTPEDLESTAYSEQY
jgi:hypothetical protein